MLSKFKKRIDQFLKTIAQQNQSQFGNDRMDCCDLNHQKQNQNQTQNQNKNKKR